MFEANDIVYFHHLHLDRPASPAPATDTDGDEKWVVVEGKPRPMLVLGRVRRVRVGTAKRGKKKNDKNCYLYGARARLGYLVLPLQSKKPQDPRIRDEFLCLRRLSGDPRDRFVQLRPFYYPPESACGRKRKRVLPHNVVDHIRKEMGMIGLGSNGASANETTCRHEVLKWYPA